MKLMFRRLCASLFLILGFQLAAADDDDNVTRIYGHGAESCGTWVANRKTPDLPSLAQTAWVLGYISGAGAALADETTKHLTHSDYNAFEVWIDNYCQQHPLDNLSTATGALVSTLEQPNFVNNTWYLATKNSPSGYGAQIDDSDFKFVLGNGINCEVEQAIPSTKVNGYTLQEKRKMLCWITNDTYVEILASCGEQFPEMKQIIIYQKDKFIGAPILTCAPPEKH